METGSSNDDSTLHFEKFGKLIYMEIETFSLNLSTISWTVHIILILILLNKLSRNRQILTGTSILQLFIIFISTITSLIWGFTIFGYSVSMLLMFHVMRSLPQEHVPVEGKAVLVTGNSVKPLPPDFLKWNNLTYILGTVHFHF